MPPRKFLWIAEGQLGDLLLMTPAIRAIHESIPGSEQTILIVQRRSYDRTGTSSERRVLSIPAGGTSAVFAANPHVAAVMDLDRALLRSLPVLQRLRAEADVIRWLRRGRFDTAVAAFPQDRFFQWTFASGARRRIGQAGLPLSFLLTHGIPHAKESIGVLAYYCRLAEATGASVGGEQTECPIPEEALNRMDEKLSSLGIAHGEPFLLVHPGSSGRFHVWPPDRYAEVIDRMRAEGVKGVLCGSPWDQEEVEAIRASCRTSPHVVIVDHGVLHLGALIRRARVLLSNDSGPRHMALAVGTRSVAVMSRFKEGTWGIYHDPGKSRVLISETRCNACEEGRCSDRIPEGESYGSTCIRDVSVARVLDAVRQFMA